MLQETGGFLVLDMRNATIETDKIQLKFTAARADGSFWLRRCHVRHSNWEQNIVLPSNMWLVLYKDKLHPNCSSGATCAQRQRYSVVLLYVPKPMLLALLPTHYRLSDSELLRSSCRQPARHTGCFHTSYRSERWVKYQTLNHGWELPSYPSFSCTQHFLTSAAFHVCKLRSVETGSQ